MSAFHGVALGMGSFLSKGATFLLSKANTAILGKSLASNKVSSEKDANGLNGRSSSLSDTLLSRLAPFEEYFVSIQSILIWEKPFVSAIALIAFNCFYWIVASWTRRFFSILSIILMILSARNCWTNHVWPEIRARAPENDEKDGWTPINPKVLSAPELSHYLNEVLTMLVSLHQWFWSFRRNKPGLFCFLSTTILSLTALIGYLVPGVVIVYIITMTIALGPGFGLYVLPDSCFYHVRHALLRAERNNLSPTLSSKPSGENEDFKLRGITEDGENNDLEESTDFDKDESSLQLLSDEQLEQTLDFELGLRSAKASLSRESSDNSLQLLPSAYSNPNSNGTETGDELEDFEIISDSEITLSSEEAPRPRRVKQKCLPHEINYKTLLESDL